MHNAMTKLLSTRTMSRIYEEIDGSASSVIHQPTGQVFSTRIIAFGELSSGQRGELSRWRFDWLAESSQRPTNVMALLAEASETVQGLISLERAEGFVAVNLLESSPHNVGQNRLFRGVAGNLFAFACAQSFAFGLDGFVAFEAKTELIEHYKTSLGARQVGRSSRMIIDSANAAQLVRQYFKETDRWPL